ncbi:MAG: DUF5963 family protein [Eubacteriales bacterium]|nr:DUF5963 family protein [Eubacteriales bacterium]
MLQYLKNFFCELVQILVALIIGFVLAMILMSVAIYFGFTNAYSTNVNALTVKILGIPIYELTKSGTEYIGKSIGIYMGAVCGICMALSVIAEEFISCAHRIRMKLIESLFKF